MNYMTYDDLVKRDEQYYSDSNWIAPLSQRDRDNLKRHRKLIGPPIMPGDPKFNPQTIQRAIAANFTNVKFDLKDRFSGEGILDTGTGMYMSLIFGQNCYVEGSSGTGKTAMMRHISGLIDAPIAEFNASAEASDFSLFGAIVPQGSGTFQFERGPLLQPGAIALMIDELPRLPAQASNVLLQAMAERNVIVPLVGAGGGSTDVLLSPGFYVQGVGNPISYGGQGLRSEALFDRFAVGLTMCHPSTDERIEMYKAAQESVYPNTMTVSEAGTTVVGSKHIIPEFTFREAHEALKHSKSSDGLLHQACAASYAISPSAFRKTVRWNDCRYYDDIVNNRNNTLKLFTRDMKSQLKELEQLVNENLYEGSNPRGELALLGMNARILALLDGATPYSRPLKTFEVQIKHVREAFILSNRARLKAFPGSENEIEKILELAASLFLPDKLFEPSVYTLQGNYQPRTADQEP